MDTRRWKDGGGSWWVRTTDGVRQVERKLTPCQGSRTPEQLENLLARAEARNKVDLLRAGVGLNLEALRRLAVEATVSRVKVRTRGVECLSS